MNLTLITFSSKSEILSDSAHVTLLSELEQYFTLQFIHYTEIDQVDKNEFTIIFIESDCVEHLIAQQFHNLPLPAIFLTDGHHNSLSAALEISAWYRAKGLKAEILHGDLTNLVRRIQILHRNFAVRRHLSGQRIGVIGTPASWLVASHVDYLLTKQRWGIEHVEIPLKRVVDHFQHISDNEVGASCAAIASQALACQEGSPEDMLKAMKIYRAIRNICVEEGLSAVTINCKKLYALTGSTACLAIAMLNDEGIVAGCDGDLQSLFTVMVSYLLTGQSGFIGNISQVNTQTNNILMSHCTVGFKQTEHYIIRNHFETESSISIQGILPTGDITLVKCGGECLDDYYLSTGTLIDNTNFLNTCRTQVQIHLDTSAHYFLKKAIGNHHILLQGNHETVLHEFFQANTCLRIQA